MTPKDAARAAALVQQAHALCGHGRRTEARTLCRQALDIDPAHFHALHLLGIVALQDHQAELAADLIGRAAAIEPANLAVQVNHGTALHEQRRYQEAIECFERALALDPCCAEALFNRGNARRELGLSAPAIDDYQRVIALRPDYADAYLNCALAWSALGRHDSALASLDRGLEVRPEHVELHYNRGNELRRLGRREEALGAYDRALAQQPGYAEAHLNRGSVLIELRHYADALSSIERAIGLRPDWLEAHLNRGAALHYLERYTAAIESYDAALALDPKHAQAHADRGWAWRELQRYEAAIASYDRAVMLRPEAGELRAVRRHLKMQIADWGGLDEDLEAIAAALREGSAAPNPFYLLGLLDSPALQRRAAELWVKERCAEIPEGRLAGYGCTERIHVGYFSADFHEHATAYLIAELLERHDRSAFRISAFSFGPPSASPMRRRLQSACEEFLDVRTQADADVAALARARRVDIAVDLKGFTQGNRIGIFAHRAAPVQVSFLGYPGTLAAPFMDHLLADSVIVPPTQAAHYSEHLLYLPNSYQCNDTRRAIAERQFTRAELGLPPAESGVVFCCFNNTYKILPLTFDCWMRILARVEGSVLWLLGDNAAAIANLRREAVIRGIAPERLVFAPRTELPVHLARHRAADLFLDTWPCNAHTTASDALWCGVPVLTYAGESFAARVAASLLTAVGLPGLIASTAAQYEERAVHLATHAQELREIKRRLHENRLTAPLFDTARYCQALEAAFTELHAGVNRNIG